MAAALKKKLAESSGAVNELLIHCMQIFYVIIFFSLVIR